MRAFPVGPVLFLSLSALPFAAKAVTVSELPTTIQSCITAGSCAVNFSSSYSSDKVSAFQIHDASTYGSTDWLMRYELVPPTGETHFDDWTGVTKTSFDGYLWMRVKGRYSASELTHPVTLFLDKVNPVPGSFYGQSGDLSLFMTTADLLAGGAYRQTLNSADYGNYDKGSLSGELPGWPPLDSQISAQLNLLQLKYASVGSSIAMAYFDPSDTRGLVYSQNLSEVYYQSSTTQAFYISAVPEPQASWMFGLGLLTVLSVSRRNRK